MSRQIAQQESTPHGTVEVRHDQDQRYKINDIPERQVSDQFLDENWKAEYGRDPATDTYLEPGPGQMTRAGEAHTSSMLAFMLPEDVAKAVEEHVQEIVGDAAESWNRLHVTLCVFDTPPDQDGVELVAEIARKVCAGYGPVTLRFTGIAQFSSSDGVFPTVATVSGNGLAALRTDLVRALDDAGIPVRSEYDLLPHTTLAYLNDQGLAVTPPTAEWTAEVLDLVTGDDEVWAEIPLPGEPRTAQKPSQKCPLDPRLILSGRVAEMDLASQRSLSCPECGYRLKQKVPNCPACGVMLVGWPEESCFVCGRKTQTPPTCTQCSEWLEKVKERSPELTEEQALQVLHKIYVEAGKKTAGKRLLANLGIVAQEAPPDIWTVTTEKAREIGDRIGVDWDLFDLEQFRQGIEVEYEHTSDASEAARIALDHLRELPDYYTRLEEVERTAQKGQEADFSVGDRVKLKDTMLGLRQGDVGEVVGVQGGIVGVAFEDHPQAALYLDKDLLDQAPEQEGEGAEGGGAEGPSVPTPMAASRLLAGLGITADWWDDLGSAGQAQYLKEHPGSEKAKEQERKQQDPLADTDQFGEAGEGHYQDPLGESTQFGEPMGEDDLGERDTEDDSSFEQDTRNRDYELRIEEKDFEQDPGGQAYKEFRQYRVPTPSKAKPSEIRYLHKKLKEDLDYVSKPPRYDRKTLSPEWQARLDVEEREKALRRKRIPIAIQQVEDAAKAKKLDLSKAPGFFERFRGSADLLASLGIELDAQSRWWADRSPEEQKKYLKEHPRSKLKPSKDAPVVSTPEGKELAPGEYVKTDTVEYWNVRGELKTIPKNRKWVPKFDHLPAETIVAYWEGGEPKPERKALVDEIVKKALEGVEPVPDTKTPVVIFTVGGPSSGKSSALESDRFKEDAERAGGFTRVDPDKVKEALPEYLEGIGDEKYYERTGKGTPGTSAENAAWMAHRESSTIADMIAAESLATRRNTLIDGTGKNLDTTLKDIQRFKDAGYHIQLIMADLDPDLARFRASERAERIGRRVPDHIIDIAYGLIPGNFDAFAELADDFVQFDAEPKWPNKPVLVREQSHLKEDEDVYDQEWLDRFNEKAERSRASRKDDKGKKAKTLDTCSRCATVKVGVGGEYGTQDQGLQKASFDRPGCSAGDSNRDCRGVGGRGGQGHGEGTCVQRECGGKVALGRHRGHREAQVRLLANLGIDTNPPLSCYPPTQEESQ